MPLPSRTMLLSIGLSLIPVSAALADDAVPAASAEVPAAAQAPAAAEAPAVAVTPEAADGEDSALVNVPLGIDAVPGVGTSGAHRGKDRRALSLGLVTWTGAVDGIEASAVGSLVEQRVDGVQLTGGVNLLAGDLDGFQGAGGVNVVAGSVDGMQLAGGANIAAGQVDGFQGAGGVNVAGGDVDGFQGAGGVNLAAGRVDGVQMAGGVNVAHGVDGSQVAVVNVSTEDVDGVQIGVINIARDSDLSLGLINIIYEGRTHLDAWTTSYGFHNVALKHGGRYFHYIYGAGWRPGGDCPEWALTLGAGGHAPISDRLFIDGDLLVQHVSPTAGLLVGTNEIATGRAIAGVQIFDRLALTGGYSYNMLFSQVQDGSQYIRGAKHTSLDEGGGLATRGWSGWQIGVQIF